MSPIKHLQRWKERCSPSHQQRVRKRFRARVVGSIFTCVKALPAQRQQVSHEHTMSFASKRKTCVFL